MAATARNGNCAMMPRQGAAVLGEQVERAVHACRVMQEGGQAMTLVPVWPRPGALGRRYSGVGVERWASSWEWDGLLPDGIG